MSANIRVLVVEDSTTVRKYLIDVLRAAPDIEVVGEAQDGSRAIELCERLRPDVITLDMMLPVMSGLAATEYIMAHFPTPILVVSSSTNRGELFKTYEALAAGAVDVLDKPQAAQSIDEWAERLVSSVRLISRIKVITHPRAKLRLASAATPRHAPEPSGEGVSSIDAAIGDFDVVAIGASTGGPAALVEILRALPSDFPLPILLVLHINATFAASFADWLDGQSELRVGYAKGGEPLASVRGRVTMAPPDYHLTVERGMLRLTTGPERNFSRPSVDVLFESLAREHGKRTMACLLTGMGRDGAAGLLRVRRAGGLTVAQDEQTSVVYGMPGEAVRLEAAQKVLSVHAIGPALADMAGRNGKRR
jgi:two-component system, chemotaxis family, protein-glutamate methylesterase/glutaminase